MTTTMTCVDLFAGLGGNSEGARQAGVKVLVAANHYPPAVEFHALNHPDTDHLCQDLHQADFSSWPDFDIMAASPACQGHSLARGADRPHHDATRSTAWAVVACAEAKRPKGLLVENVCEFSRWCLFPEWRRCLEKLGYTLHLNELDSADFGVAQHRKRLFITGIHRSVSDKPVVVPNPCKQHVPVSDILNFASGKWSRVLKAGRALATLRRWTSGHERHGERFLMPYFGSGSGTTGRCLSRPVGTLTTRDRWALVDGGQMRMLTSYECRRAMGFGEDYIIPESHKTAIFMLGNAVVPAVARGVFTALADRIMAA
jgi:DNA (cytosine-5)-methyltransferase 1